MTTGCIVHAKVTRYFFGGDNTESVSIWIDGTPDQALKALINHRRQQQDELDELRARGDSEAAYFVRRAYKVVCISVVDNCRLSSVELGLLGIVALDDMRG